MATTVPPPYQDSRLGALPAELRAKIYYYAVVEEGLVEAATYLADCMDDEDCEWKNNERALAKTCRQDRLEVLPIYYGCNTFTLQDLQYPQNKERCIAAWLSSLGQYAQIVNHVGARIQIRPPRIMRPSSYDATSNRTRIVDRIDGMVTATVMGDQPTKLHFNPPKAGKCYCSGTRYIEDYQEPNPALKSQVDKVTRIKVFFSKVPASLDTYCLKDRRCGVCRLSGASMI